MSNKKDISELKRTQDALAASERRYRELFENASDIVFTCDPQGNFTSVNGAGEQTSGYSRAELACMNVFQILAPEYVEEGRRVLEGLAAGREPGISEWEIVTKDGHRVRLEAGLRLVQRNGEPAEVQGIARDITERKRVEEALRVSEAKFRALSEGALAAIIIYQGNRIRYANPAAEVITGYSHHELLKMNFWDLAHPDFREQVRERGLARQRGEAVPQHYEFKIITKAGEERWLDFSDGNFELEGKLAVVGTAFDITERKRAEQALEQAAKRFKLVTLATQDALYDWDLVSHEIWRNENYQRLFGAPERSLDSDNWWDHRLHPEDRERVLTAQAGALGSEGNLFSSEFRLRRLDGSYADIVERSLIVRDANGQAVRMTGALTDMSERKQAEEALRESEARFRAVFENAAIGVALVDMHGRPVESNPAIQKMLGYSKTELAQMTFSHFTHPDDVDESRDLFTELVEGKHDRYQLVKRYNRKDGRIVWGQLTQSLVRNQNGDPEYTIAMVEDISERKRAEEQVRDYLAQLNALTARLHSAREDERARLAREIHDELGQNLTAIKIDLTSIFRKLGENAKPLSGATESILKLVDQTIRTVRRIATELRPGILDDLGLTAAIQWATEEFQARTGIKCQVELGEEHIFLDRERTTAIFRIFQETLTNVARHSGATELWVRLFRQNANTILEVQDNGVGIQPQHLTSPASLGILGMRERALALGGKLEIVSGPVPGTIVSVRIPDLSPSVEV